MFISPALAQGAGGGLGGGGYQTILMMVLIFAVFYFLLIRPQQKRAKQHRDMLSAVRRGDRVVTGGGIMGTVTKVLNDLELQVEIAEGIRVRVQRGMISQVISKGQPAAGQAGPAAQPDGGQQGGGSLLGKLFGGR